MSGQRIHISVSLINALTIHKLIITECTKIQVGLERVILTIQYMLLVLLTCANLTLEKNVSAWVVVDSESTRAFICNFCLVEHNSHLSTLILLHSHLSSTENAFKHHTSKSGWNHNAWPDQWWSWLGGREKFDRQLCMLTLAPQWHHAWTWLLVGPWMWIQNLYWHSCCHSFKVPHGLCLMAQKLNISGESWTRPPSVSFQVLIHWFLIYGMIA